MKNLKVILKKLIYIIFFLFILSLVYLLKLNSSFSLINYFKNDIQKYISYNIDMPFKYELSNENFDDFYYNISLKNVSIRKNKIENVSIYIDIIKSIKEMKLSISEVYIDDSNIYLFKNKKGIFFDLLSNKKNTDFNIPHYIKKIFDSTNIELRNVSMITENNYDSNIIDGFNVKIKFEKESLLFSIINDNEKGFYANVKIDNNDLNLNSKGDFDFLYKVLNNSPLVIFSDYIDKDWEIKKEIEILVNYNIIDPKKFNIDINFFKNELIMKNLNNLRISDINGSLKINPKNKNLLTMNAYGNFYGNKQKVNLVLEDNKNINITSYGYLNIQLFNAWLKNDFLDDMIGGSIFKTEINILKNQKNISVKSDLQGVQSLIPYPFQKKKEDKTNFIFYLNFENNNAFIHFNNHNLKINNKNKKVNNILVGLNSLTPKNITDGIAINGYIDKFDIGHIYSYIKNKIKPKNSNYLFINEIDVKSSIIKYKSHEIVDSEFKMSLDNNKEYSIKLSSKEINIDALVDLKQKKYIADISKLKYNIKSKDIDNISSEFKDYNILKGGKIRIQDFSINDENISNLRIDIPENNNPKNFEIYATSLYKNTNLNLKLNYNYDNNTTSILPFDNEYLFYGENINDFTSRTNPKSKIKSNDFNLKGNLFWKGDPLNFSPNFLNGELDFEIKDFEMRGLKDDYLNMKIFKLFNFDNFFKMLSFDFELISNKKIKFDDIKIKYVIEKGIMKSEIFNLKNDDFSIKIDGFMDLELEKLDKKIEVLMPVSEQFTGISLVVGASPQTAGILFLIDKLMGDELNKLFKVKFRLHGDFNELEFEKM